MLPPDTGRAMRAIRLLDAAERHGLDRDELRRSAGIDPDQIDDPDKRLATPLVLRLWHRLVEEVSDPDLGLEIGTHGEVRQGGVVGYAMMHSRNVGQAIRRLTRFGRLISTSTDFELVETPEIWRLTSTRPPLAPGFRPPTDAAASMLVTVLREITGRQIDPVAAQFTYPRPADLTQLRAVLRGDLEFAANRDSITFRARDMRIALLQPEERLAHYLDRLAEQDLAALPSWDTFSRRVGRTIWQRLSEGQPTVAQVARELGLSSRTLQRRLREEGTSFARIVDDVRRQLAPTLLRDGSLAVYEVAYLLGYADPSAFFRAFRRWHGFSPARYRQQDLRGERDEGQGP